MACFTSYHFLSGCSVYISTLKHLKQVVLQPVSTPNWTVMEEHLGWKNRLLALVWWKLSFCYWTTELDIVFYLLKYFLLTFYCNRVYTKSWCITWTNIHFWLKAKIDITVYQYYKCAVNSGVIQYLNGNYSACKNQQHFTASPQHQTRRKTNSQITKYKTAYAFAAWMFCIVLNEKRRFPRIKLPPVSNSGRAILSSGATHTNNGNNLLHTKCYLQVHLQAIFTSLQL